MSAQLENQKFYIQPLGLLRGFTVPGDVFERLAGSDIYFSALKIICRCDGVISEEIISVAELPAYLDSQQETVGEEIGRLLDNITRERPPLDLKDGLVINWHNPVIQGVLNITPDSFSDGGWHDDFEKSLCHARAMIGAGADIIDIGGETTKPGAKAVSLQAEKDRVLPATRDLANSGVPISIDSRNSTVMKDAISAGAHMINDVSALSHDPASIDMVKEADVPVILMHAQGSPETMQDNPVYENVLLEIYDYLESRIDICLAAGISKDKIIVDPGIGFGKTVDHNLLILQGISLLHGLGVPLLVGASRKSFIGKISGEAVAAKRVAGSIAAVLSCLEQGVQIVRVHDVEQIKQAVSIWQATHKKR